MIESSRSGARCARARVRDLSRIFFFLVIHRWGPQRRNMGTPPRARAHRALGRELSCMGP